MQAANALFVFDIFTIRLAIFYYFCFECVYALTFVWLENAQNENKKQQTNKQASEHSANTKRFTSFDERGFSVQSKVLHRVANTR